MTTIAQIILAIALVLSIILPFGYYLIGEKNRGRYNSSRCKRILLLWNHAYRHCSYVHRCFFRTGSCRF